MDDWDEPAADAAVAALARTAGANEIFETLFRYGARDFRSIGHKAIYVANSCRTLACIGWQHAEPVLRSLAYALLSHEGDNPARRDDAADRPYRRNLELVENVSRQWRGGKLDDAATGELLATLRTKTNDDACDQVVDMLNRGVAPQSIWDAFQVAAGELLMRQPGIVALHAVTTTNALHYAYQASGNNQTRLLMMLQNAAFLPMFREAMAGRGEVKDLTVEVLAAAQSDAKPAGVDEIFAELGRDPMSAARQALAHLNSQSGEWASAEELIDAARLLVFLKGNDAHDYKFSSAILEDYYHVSPQWRNQCLALNMFKLRSALDRDNGLVERTRSALKT
jgi:hypothetical protein